jgi:hypothetical protein
MRSTGAVPRSDGVTAGTVDVSLRFCKARIEVDAV